MFDLEIISTLLFFAIVGILVYRDRKHIQYDHGIIIKKWTRGKEAIDNFVNKHSKLIMWIGNFAVVAGVIASVAGFALLLKMTLSFEQMFGIILPSISAVKYPEPVVSVPFWYWLIGVFVIMTSHEFMHAVFSRLERVSIKSFGIILFFVLPIGAFVDPSQKQIEKLKTLSKLRIYAAGSFGNLLIAGLVFLISIITVNMFVATITEAGVSFKQTIAGTPAENVSMSGVIYQINSTAVKSIKDFEAFMNNTAIANTIIVKTSSGSYTVKTIPRPDDATRPFIGIQNMTQVYNYRFGGYVPDYMFDGVAMWLRLLFWIFVISFGVGVANLLPMKPFDGGYIFEEFFKRLFGKKHSKTAIKIMTIITIGLLLTNIGIRIAKYFIK